MINITDIDRSKNYSMKMIADELELHLISLFDELRKKKVLYKDPNGFNRVRADLVEKGYFIEGKGWNPTGKPFMQPFATPKGKELIKKIFIPEANVPLVTFQEVDMDDVMNYFAKDFDVKMSSFEYFLDPVKEKVVFKIIH